MNYRHAFHAGNHGDVLKHVILLACLEHLRQKPAPFAALDTHAGPGRYDLTGAEAERSPEWRGGAARAFDWPLAPAGMAPYREALAAANPDGALRVYPGSPLLIRRALRERDRLIACELHPQDGASLKALFRHDKQAQIHQRDGWGALRALLPTPERRGLVLIDPPYEAPGECSRAAREIGGALARLPGGIFLWWRPLKEPAEVDAADAELRTRAQSTSPERRLLRVDLAVERQATAGLSASSVMIANPPFAFERMMNEVLPALSARLARGAGAWCRLS